LALGVSPGKLDGTEAAMLSTGDDSIIQRRAVVQRAREGAAERAVRQQRLNGTVSLIGALAGTDGAGPHDYRRFFMAWQATRVLRPIPTVLLPAAGRSRPPLAHGLARSSVNVLVTDMVPLREPSQPGWLDHNGRRRLLDRLQFAMPRLALVFTDGGDAGRLVRRADHALRVVMHTVGKPYGQQGFAVLPRRWVAERTMPWLMRCGRVGRDANHFPRTARRWPRRPSSH